MPVSVVVTTSGTEKLVRLAAAIKAAGDKELSKELDKAMRQLVTPLKRSARQGALAILPHRGGLDERVAASRFTARVRKVGSGAGVTIRAAGQYNLNRMDDGRNRHPVWAHGPRSGWGWANQTIRPGWFTNPLLLDAPKQRDEIVAAIDRIARKLETAG